MIKAFENEIPIKWDKKTRQVTERKALLDLFFTDPGLFYKRFTSLFNPKAPASVQTLKESMKLFLEELSKATLAWAPYIQTYQDVKYGLIIDSLFPVLQSNAEDTLPNKPLEVLSKLDIESFIKYVHEFKHALGLKRYDRARFEQKILELIK